ncbi:hypothetical protein AVEN_43900-1, partial [Araneus ventricosus]
MSGQSRVRETIGPIKPVSIAAIKGKSVSFYDEAEKERAIFLLPTQAFHGPSSYRFEEYG